MTRAKGLRRKLDWCGAVSKLAYGCLRKQQGSPLTPFCSVANTLASAAIFGFRKCLQPVRFYDAATTGAGAVVSS
jgi:hypothetical protein